MDCNFTIIKTCELKNSTFRSRILDFGDFDISDYTFSAVYKTGFDQVISEQELTAIGNILTVPLEAIEGTSNRAKAEIWMLRDGGFKDKVIVFDVVISATGCPSDASITEGVSVTFGGMKVPVEVNQGIVNISREVAFSTLSPDEKSELKGEKGEQGEAGDVGPQGPQGDPLTFPDLTTEQVNELKQPAIEAAALANQAATNADTAAGLATDATVEAVSATGQAIAATAQAENAADTAQDAAQAALDAAANTVMRYNDSVETVAADVLTRIDKRTGLPVTYREVDKRWDGEPLNLDWDKVMTDDQVDGFIYIKVNGKYYINTDFKVNREVYVSSYHSTTLDYVPTPTYKTIAEKYPDVTLAEVQELDPDATLADSSDWYILMWLNKILPINTKVYFTQHFALTRDIKWRRSHIHWEGKPFEHSDKNPNYLRPLIIQTVAGMNVITIKEGDGVTSSVIGRVENIGIKNIGLVGKKTSSLLTGDGISIDTTGDFIYSNFEKMTIAYHGKNGIRHYNGHVNDINFYDVSCYGNFDTGMYWNGTPQSQTNMFDFEKCSFSLNGSVIRNGELVPYDWHIDGDGPDGIYRITKGGMSFGNLSATSFKAVATQENHGFGIMFRENASVAGVVMSLYGEGDPLGSLVILARLDSDITINSSSVHTYGIYPEVMSPEHWIYSLFKSEEHYRKFIQRAGIEHNKELHNRPWSENLITDAKNRTPLHGGGTYTHAYTRDDLGSLVTTIYKDAGAATTIEWFTVEEFSKPPLYLDEGDLVSFSFDIKYDVLTGEDLGKIGIGDFGTMRYKSKIIVAPDVADGTWMRIHFTHEHKGVYDNTNAWPRPYMYIAGVNPVTFSVRNPEFKIKSKNTVFAESAPNASATLKGVVNQAAAVANVAAADATDLDTAIALVNELKAKLNAKLGADRTAGQQAT